MITFLHNKDGSCVITMITFHHNKDESCVITVTLHHNKDGSCVINVASFHHNFMGYNFSSQQLDGHYLKEKSSCCELAHHDCRDLNTSLARLQRPCCIFAMPWIHVAGITVVHGHLHQGPSSRDTHRLVQGALKTSKSPVLWRNDRSLGQRSRPCLPSIHW